MHAQTTGKTAGGRATLDMMASLLDRLPAPPVLSPCRPRGKQADSVQPASLKEMWELQNQWHQNSRKDKPLLPAPVRRSCCSRTRRLRDTLLGGCLLPLLADEQVVAKAIHVTAAAATGARRRCGGQRHHKGVCRRQ